MLIKIQNQIVNCAYSPTATFQFIMNRDAVDLRCENCGESRSVKYVCKGKAYCNACILLVA